MRAFLATTLLLFAGLAVVSGVQCARADVPMKPPPKAGPPVWVRAVLVKFKGCEPTPDHHPCLPTTTMEIDACRVDFEAHTETCAIVEGTLETKHPLIDALAAEAAPAWERLMSP